VTEGHRTGEGDLIGMRLFSKTEQLPAFSFPLFQYRGIMQVRMVKTVKSSTPITHPAPEVFITVGKPYGPLEFKEKGSRFISYLYPVTSVAEAETIIAGLRKQYHDASHVCFALRLGEGVEEYSRFNDDGEPGGTAGLPIFNEIKTKDFFNVLAAVVRYFGGTKLGTGGLVRAYGEAARNIIHAAEPLTVTLKKEISLVFPYPLTGEIMHLVNRCSLEILSQEYTAAGVSMMLAVPLARTEEVSKAVSSIGRGRVKVR
jgi:uncharacterized YigZ family protein